MSRIIDREGTSMAEENGKNGKKVRRLQGRTEPSHEISELGRQLREISDKALAAGTKVLSGDQINELVAEIRGGR